MSKVQNILTVYQHATNQEIDSGMTWYNEAHDTVKQWAKEYDQPPQVVAYALAALSPRVQWEPNKRACKKLLDLHRQGRKPHYNRIVVAGTKTNKAKAIDIIWKHELDRLKGPKVTRFADNILNPETSDKITVDVWAVRAADLDPHADAKWLGPDPRYNRYEQAYLEASALLAQPPIKVQAVCWLVIQRLKKLTSTYIGVSP